MQEDSACLRIVCGKSSPNSLRQLSLAQLIIKQYHKNTSLYQLCLNQTRSNSNQTTRNHATDAINFLVR